MRRAARVDANHSRIVSAFRKLGCLVHDSSRAGMGFPDLVVCFQGVFALVEVKTPKGKPTEAQERFFADWPVSTVRDENGVAMVVKMLRERAWR